MKRKSFTTPFKSPLLENSSTSKDESSNNIKSNQELISKENTTLDSRHKSVLESKYTNIIDITESQVDEPPTFQSSKFQSSTFHQANYLNKIQEANLSNQTKSIDTSFSKENSSTTHNLIDLHNSYDNQKNVHKSSDNQTNLSEVKSSQSSLGMDTRPSTTFTSSRNLPNILSRMISNTSSKNNFSSNYLGLGANPRSTLSNLRNESSESSTSEKSNSSKIIASNKPIETNQNVNIEDNDSSHEKNGENEDNIFNENIEMNFNPNQRNNIENTKIIDLTYSLDTSNTSNRYSRKRNRSFVNYYESPLKKKRKNTNDNSTIVNAQPLFSNNQMQKDTSNDNLNLQPVDTQLNDYTPKSQSSTNKDETDEDSINDLIDDSMSDEDVASEMNDFLEKSDEMANGDEEFHPDSEEDEDEIENESRESEKSEISGTEQLGEDEDDGDDEDDEDDEEEIPDKLTNNKIVSTNNRKQMNITKKKQVGWESDEDTEEISNLEIQELIRQVIPIIKSKQYFEAEE